MNVGNSLKIALMKKGMTQTQLAAQMDKHFTWVNNMANKRTASSANIELLAEALDMKVSEFIALGEE